MSDLKKYIKTRKKRDKNFFLNFDEGYQAFKIGVMLKEARELEIRFFSKIGFLKPRVFRVLQEPLNDYEINNK
jgi:hypothetical protein